MPEATALIEALKLDPGPKFGSIRIFGQQSDTPLAVTGMGAHASATAVGLLRAQQSQDARPSFLNVGVAGHSTWSPGQAWLAHQVRDGSDPSHAIYPGFYERPHLPTDLLTTRAKVEQNFQDAGGYDMEGFGFLNASLCFASAEQCALLKVVSDGPSQHEGPEPFRLDAKRARALIYNTLPEIQRQIEVLTLVSHILFERSQAPKQFQDILKHKRFSQAQQHRLRSLLTQWDARFPDTPLDLELFDAGAQAGLDAIHAKLSAYQPLHPLSDES